LCVQDAKLTENEVTSAYDKIWGSHINL